jgi:hypothetical protein
MAHFIVHDPILGVVVEMYHAPSLAWKVNPFSTSTGRGPKFNLLPDLEKHDISQLLVFVLRPSYFAFTSFRFINTRAFRHAHLGAISFSDISGEAPLFVKGSLFAGL